MGILYYRDHNKKTTPTSDMVLRRYSKHLTDSTSRNGYLSNKFQARDSQELLCMYITLFTNDAFNLYIEK